MSKSGWVALNRTGRAKYPFTPAEGKLGKGQLSLKVNETVNVVGENKGWYRGCSAENTSVMGIFPANYIELIDESVDHKPRSSVAEVDIDPLAEQQSELRKQERLLKEVSANIKLWGKKARELLRDGEDRDDRDTPSYFQIKSRIGKLVHWRGILVSDSRGRHEKEEAQEVLFKMLEAYRKSQAGFLVPRLVHGDNVSDHGMVEVFELYNEMQEDMIEGNKVSERFVPQTGRNWFTNAKEKRKRTSSSLSSREQSSERKILLPLLHVYLEYKSSPCPVGEPFEIYFSLFLKSARHRASQADTAAAAKLSASGSGRFLTEEFKVTVTEKGLPNMELYDKLKTVFQNIQPEALEEGLYLVCKVYRKGDLEAKASIASGNSLTDSFKRRVGTPTAGGNETNYHTYRRPYGVGVASLSKFSQKIIDPEWEPNGLSIPILIPRAKEMLEENFSGLHDMIINDPGDIAETQKDPPRWADDGGFVAVRLFAAFGSIDDLSVDLAEVEGESIPDVRSSSKTPSLYMQRAADPNCVRDDLYVTLRDGSFSRDGKKSDKNIEVRVQAVLDTGATSMQLIRGVGPGNELTGDFFSSVYYHNGKPKYNETFRLAIPGTEIYRMHLLFIYYHVSSKRKKTHAFAYSFLRLTDKNDGLILQDGQHNLNLYDILPRMGEKTIKPDYLDHGPLALQKNKRSGDAFCIETRLRSTQRSTSIHLHQLLAWRDKNLQEASLVSILKNIERETNIAQSSVAKIVDVLVDVMETAEYEATIDECFKTFVHVFSSLSKTSNNFPLTMDIYLRDVLKVSSKAVHTHLVSKVTRLIDWLSKVGEKDRSEWKSMDVDNLNVAQKLMSSFSYVIKLAIAAAYKVAEMEKASATQTLIQFKKSLLELQYNLNIVMGKESKVVEEFQEKTLQNFTAVFEALSKLFNYSELGEITRDFFESFSIHKSETLTIKREKLKALHATIVGRNKYIYQTDFRSRVLPCIVVTLRKHMASQDEIERGWCIMVCKDLVNIIHKSNSSNDAWSICYLLPSILNMLKQMLGGMKGAIACKNTRASAESLGLKGLSDVAHTVCSLFGIVQMSNPLQMDHFLKTCLGADPEIPSTRREMYTFTRDLLDVCCHLITLEEKLFPEMWAVLCMTQQQCTFTILKWLSKPLRSEFRFQEESGTAQEDVVVHGGESSVSNAEQKELWFSFLTLGLAMLNSDTLDLENSSASRREYILKQIGDIRVDVCKLVQEVWDSMGRLKLAMIYRLVEPLLRLADLQHEQTRALSTDMYFSLLHDEVVHTNSVAKVRFVTINSVDLIVNERSIKPANGPGRIGGEPSSKVRRTTTVSRVKKRRSTHLKRSDNSANVGQGFEELFTVRLRAKVEKDPNLNIQETLTFLDDVKELFDLLSVLSKFGGTVDIKHEDEQTQAMLRLMAYLQKSDRHDMYVKYVYRLHKIHLELGNHSESAEVLLMHASYPWKNGADVPEFWCEEFDWPRESISDRQARVYRHAVDIFDAGKNWEKCVEYCDKLKSYYERTFAYDQVASVLREQASYFEMVTEKKRFYPTHFRVSFIGFAYDTDISNKVFVYRGRPLESIMDFCTRIRQKFSETKTVPPGKETNEMKTSLTTKYIQISTVTPAFDEEIEHKLPSWMGPKATPNVVDYRRNFDTGVFWLSRPFRKAKEKSKNEFMDLWNKKIFLRTSFRFPGLQRRAEVAGTIEHFQNPLEVAVETVLQKNKDLKRQIAIAEKLDGRTATQSFTMAINGTVDAAVNGGIANYAPFLNGSFREDHPEIAEDIASTEEKSKMLEVLNSALEDHLVILKKGVVVHARVCIEQMIPLHEMIAKKFPILLEQIEKLGVKVPAFFAPPAKVTPPASKKDMLMKRKLSRRRML